MEESISIPVVSSRPVVSPLPMIIPAKTDGDEVLNAFALGIQNLIKNGIIKLSDIESLMRIGHHSILNDPMHLNFLNYVLLNANYAEGQQILAQDLHVLVRTLLQTSAIGRKWLYGAFKQALFRYCAKKLNITIPLTEYAFYENSEDNKVCIFKNVYNFDKLPAAQVAFSNLVTFLQNFTNKVPSELDGLKDLIEKPAIDAALHQSWNDSTNGLHIINGIRSHYIQALDDKLFGVGDIELRLLAEKFEVSLKVKRFGDYMTIYKPPFEQKLPEIILNNDFEVKQAILLDLTSAADDKDKQDKVTIIPRDLAAEYEHSWATVLAIDTPLENSYKKLMGEYYYKLRLCYQFLDKLFDDSIFNLGYKDFDPDPYSGYIDFKTKREFFHLFRQRFSDEDSQISGWRGLRNWVAKKDMEAKNHNPGDSLNHEMKEFVMLMKLLFLKRFNAIRGFAERTSISHFALSNFDASDITNLINLVGAIFPIVAALTTAHNAFKSVSFTITQINGIKTALGAIPPPNNLLANRLNSKIVPNNNDLIDVTRANFTYRTLRKLVEKRYGYAKYLEYARDPSKFMVLFNLDIKNKDPNIQKKIRRKLGICKSENERVREIGIWFRPIGVLFNGMITRQETDANLYTYDGWSVRQCCNIQWLLSISLLFMIPFLAAFIIPRSFYKLDSEPDDSGTKTAYEIMNSVAGMIIPIFTLFIGIGIIAGWNNYHNWFHDKEERKEYHKDMAKLLYRTNLYKLMEKIEVVLEMYLDQKVVNAPISALANFTIEEVEELKWLIGRKYQTLKNLNLHAVDYKTALFSQVDVTKMRLKLAEKDNLKAKNLSTKLKDGLYNIIYNSLRDPNVDDNIEETIIKHINEATKEEKNPIEDISEFTGEGLQRKRIRRAYIKWDVGVRIKEELKEKQPNELYWHYGFFSGNGEKPNRPNDCHSFDDVNSLPGVKTQLIL